ncbi:MAG: VWA domain-containing protein, partial [candidate division WOR-3 bacterium]
MQFGYLTNTFNLVFAHPQILWVGAIVELGLIGFFLWAWIRRKRDINKFVQPKLLAQLTVGVSLLKTALRYLFFVFGIGLLFIALARPWHGLDESKSHSIPKEVAILIDVSKSMEAADVQPDRITLAKAATQELIKRANDTLISIVVFAGEPGVLTPPSAYTENLIELVKSIHCSYNLSPGTDIGAAIECALSLLSKTDKVSKTLFLFSDGEDFGENILRAIELARSQGCSIFVGGIGTKEGAMVKITKDGPSFTSSLNEFLLQKIAQDTAGVYVKLESSSDIDYLIEKWNSNLNGSSIKIERYKEQFQWFAGLALLFFVLEMILPDRRWRLPHKLHDTFSNSVANMQIVTIMLTTLNIPSPTIAEDPGYMAIKEGNFAEAYTYYQNFLKRYPNNLNAYYNLGIAAAKLERYEEAILYFSKASNSQDRKLSGSALYNLGTCLFIMGKTEKNIDLKRQLWEQALQSYQLARSYIGEDPDLEWNSHILKAWLKTLDNAPSQKPNVPLDKSPHLSIFHNTNN